MNRNNLFMISYIVFIGVCAIFKIIWDYPMWGRIVAAITCSSWFFALADSEANEYTDLDEYVKIYSNYGLQSSDKIKSVLDELNRKLLELKNGEEAESNDPNITERIRHFEKIIAIVKECDSECEEEKEKAQNDQLLMKRKEIMESVYTVVGFFSFFCVLTFETVANLAIDLQDQLTVYAFGLILLTQYISGEKRTLRNRKQEQMQELCRKWDNLLIHVQGVDVYAD